MLGDGQLLAGKQPLAVAQLELAQVDRSASQPRAVGPDLADSADADEHAAPLDRDHDSVHAGRLGAEVDDPVDDPSNIRSIGAEQRQPRQPGDVDDPTLHIVGSYPRLAVLIDQ